MSTPQIVYPPQSGATAPTASPKALIAVSVNSSTKTATVTTTNSVTVT